MPERAGHGIRRADDYYATTPDLAALCCRTLASDFIAQPKRILDPSSILEPTAGSGSWIPGIMETWPEARISAIEQHPELAEYASRFGLTVEAKDIFAAELGTYDLIVGNPPFSLADDLIPMLMSRLNPGGVLAFLLRLNFFGGQDRYERFWRIFPAACAYPLPARPGFTSDGKTDGTEYMMCCWVKDYAGITQLRHLDNRFVQNKWAGTPHRPDPLFYEPVAAPSARLIKERNPLPGQLLTYEEASRLVEGLE